ncbi:MAG TPA: hypothetical protein VG206_02930 [Terriglobia bacterium]|nr:hypothetical protein [Terriglobia bacterium]
MSQWITDIAIALSGAIVGAFVYALKAGQKWGELSTQVSDLERNAVTREFLRAELLEVRDKIIRDVTLANMSRAEGNNLLQQITDVRADLRRHLDWHERHDQKEVKP